MTSADKPDDTTAVLPSYKERVDKYITTAIGLIKGVGEKRFSKVVKKNVRDKKDGHPILAPLHKKLFPENSDP